MNEIRPIFGVECEMAFSPLDERHRRVDYDNLWWDFLRIACARYRHLPGQESTGVFLANGARLYLDGLKPEITTPEVTNPTDACRYIRAGEEILWDISRQMIRELDEVHEVVITRNNVHYGSRATAWGCHESYGHRCESAELPAAFIPHAVSRIIFTGAGGFDNHSPGTRFLISPRVPHLWAVSSRHTQENRGIFNLKDEPLNEAGIQRLHVICGEHQCSLSAQWLKLATTALVVAMAQAGVKPGHGLALCEPLTAMRDFAADTTLTATAAMGDGSRMTALDIQRRLLKKAKSFSFAGPLNDWHADACQLWERTLDQLQHDRSAAQRSIDWAIKHDLFTCHLEARGLSWEQLEQWDVILEKSFQLYGAEKGYMGCWSHPLTKEELRDWLYEHRRELDPRHKVNWKDLERLLATRYELFELDSRFGELGDRGIFHQLDQLDLLNHHVPGVENISEAITDPPSDTRARARGLAIQEIALRGDEGACEWDGLWDTCKNRRLDLSDPFQTQRRWEQLERRRPQFVRFRRLQVSTAFGDAMKCFERGEYDAALTLLTGLQRRLHLLPAEMLRQFYRFRAGPRPAADGSTARLV